VPDARPAPGAKTATFPPLEKTEKVPPPAPPPGAAPAAGVAPVPGYKPLRKLGAGTYGEVWLFEEERTGIRVAVKFFARGWGMEWQLLQAEVRQLALLHADPGIVQLEDVEPDANPPYYVMSYAAGGSLAQLLEGGRRLPVRQALKIFREAAQALAYVHAKGIRHCDLKPGNILLDARGRALIGDFGQAHLASDASPALGTFFYMAPEQADLDRTSIPDTRWDVYGLGALFYAMLTGAPPREQPGLFDAAGAPLTLPQRLQRYREAVLRAPRPTAHRRLPGMDAALAALLDHCLEVDPEHRLRDAGAVLEALARRDRARRRKPLLVFGLAAPLLLLLTMTAFAYRNGRKEIDAAGEQLARQLQESDRVSARLVANVVQENLNDRIDFLEDFRKDHAEGLRAVQDGPKAAPKLCELLDKLHHMGKPRKFFHQYSLTDRQGHLLAGAPDRLDWLLDKQGPQRRWAFRDWFNGLGDQRGREGDAFEPVHKPHISQPYVSRVPGRPFFSVNVTVPLFDATGRHVLGVLTGQIVIEGLHSWLNGVAIRDGFVVLLNDRGHCLKHDRSERIHPDDNEGPIDWRRRSELFDRALGAEPGDGLAVYTDPIAEKEYLAGYAPFPEQPGRPTIHWLALVQHDRAAVLRPVADLEANLRFNCAVALGLGALLTTGLWAWMVFTLRREERLAQA
jgi:serine/threonine protein kinase